jgi:pimeloyl-ACP methyl ester carboxylesterase
VRPPQEKEKHVKGKEKNPLVALGGLSMTAAMAWISYSKLLVPHNLPLPPAVSGERHEFTGRAGRLSYYVAGETGQAAPLLLIHSINAAGSAYEVRPLFEHYKTHRRVYALDLPGFGFSERSDRQYTPRLYTDAILDMLEQIARDVGPTPVDTLALSLSAEFLARAAIDAPERCRSLALVTPTGFRRSQERYAEIGATLGNSFVRDLFDLPLWSRPFYDLLTSKPSIRFFLAQTFGAYEPIPTELVEYDYLTTHQPGAQHAPYAFVSGLLFSADIGRIYDALQLPVWLAYGTRGAFSNFQDLKNVQVGENWSIQAFGTGALPHFEQLEAVTTAYDGFLARITGA